MSDRDPRDGHRYDVGDESDEHLPVDPSFERWIAEVAPTLNDPPPTPRLEMWQAIERTAVPAPRLVRPLRVRRWVVPSAIAAALLLGIGVDRVVLRRRGSEREATTTRSAVRTDSLAPARLYRLAAVQTLTQAEALLTAYRASEASSQDAQQVQQLSVWGRQVLSSTRLLIDSPAGDDPQLRPLLEDLELVLVQVIQLSGAPLDASERALIDGALENRDLLPRIRTAVPAGVGAAVTE